MTRFIIRKDSREMSVLISWYKDGFTECVILLKGKCEEVVRDGAWRALSLLK